MTGPINSGYLVTIYLKSMPSADSRISSWGAARIETFRGQGIRQPLPSAERWLLVILGVQICFLPWALGTMHWRSQVMSVTIAAVGFGVAMWPRKRPFETTVDRPAGWRRLQRFPIFWIGLALVVYVGLQGANPSWRYAQSDSRWWLIRVPSISWLPTGVDAPFPEANAWRQGLIYATTWLLACSAWMGLTRRRSLRILLEIIAGNALLLSGLLAIQRIVGNHRIPWPLTTWTAYDLTGSFIYENHAGAYLALAATCAITLAIWFFDNGSRSLAKSTPSGVFAIAAIFLIGAVFFTLSRGAVLALILTMLIIAGWLLLRLRFRRRATSAKPMLKFGIAAVFLSFTLVTISNLDFTQIYGRWNSLLTEKNNEQSVRFRLLAREAASRMLADNWVRGVGAGDFRYLFPEYAKSYPEIYQNGDLFWEHAHCDWLEFPIELGLVGDLFILTGAGWWLIWFVRRRMIWNPLAMPLLLGCLQPLIHAGFDFPFQCPAILSTWCLLMVIAAKSVEIEHEK